MLQIQLAKKKDFIRIIKECLSETRGKVILFWKHKAEENDGEKEILLLVPIFYPGVGEWILWCYTQSLGDKGPEEIVSELAKEIGVAHTAEIIKISANGEELDV